MIVEKLELCSIHVLSLHIEIVMAVKLFWFLLHKVVLVPVQVFILTVAESHFRNDALLIDVFLLRLCLIKASSDLQIWLL